MEDVKVTSIVGQESDPVNKPSHYRHGGIECLDVIKAALDDEGFKAFCLGNSIKYIYRHKYKGKPLEDLKKAQFYLNKTISEMETSESVADIVLNKTENN